jgi:hypothetical protein
MPPLSIRQIYKERKSLKVINRERLKVKTNFKIFSAMMVSAVSCAAFADPYGAPPDDRHAWGVHDDYRPGVKKITADGVRPPSDAVVLFDGTSDSISANWCDKDGAPTKWKLNEAGELVSVKGAGYIFTKGKFADCQLHVEWASPEKVQGTGQARGNSGVFLMGEYEIQVLDSYETDPSKNPNPNPNYSDGQAGAVYGQNPPAVNPCRAPGVFNTYDIIFHAPRFNADGSVRSPATVTVLFNGVLVQDNWKFDGPTGFRRRATYKRAKGDSGLERTSRMPIAFQDHGNPVRYRNVWLREIPHPDDNTVHGDYYAKRDDVLRLRAQTAVELDRDFDVKWSSVKPGRRLLEAWRVVTYEKTPARMARVSALEKEFLEIVATAEKKDLSGKLGIPLGVLKEQYTDFLNLKLVDEGNAVFRFLNDGK